MIVPPHCKCPPYVFSFFKKKQNRKWKISGMASIGKSTTPSPTPFIARVARSVPVFLKIKVTG
jgi:hypothetical protein